MSTDDEDLARHLARRIREAERIEKQKFHPEPKKRRWLKTTCPNCGARIEYSPKKNWDGQFRCTSCGKPFKLTLLDRFKEVW